jgi:hypothetical protein
MSSPATLQPFTPSSIASGSTFKSTPDLRRAAIDATGGLVFRPEHEHEQLDYRARETTGAYAGARLNILDHDPLDEFAREKFANIHQSVKKNVKWLGETFAAGRTKANDAYEAIATPAKKHYHLFKTVPSRANTKLKEENRAVRNELELLRLKLAETRLQMAEARMRSKELGISTCMHVIWVCLILVSRRR